MHVEDSRLGGMRPLGLESILGPRLKWGLGLSQGLGTGLVLLLELGPGLVAFGGTLGMDLELDEVLTVEVASVVLGCHMPLGSTNVVWRQILAVLERLRTGLGWVYFQCTSTVPKCFCLSGYSVPLGV
jgi:hypothetical protein